MGSVGLIHFKSSMALLQSGPGPYPFLFLFFFNHRPFTTVIHYMYISFYVPARVECDTLLLFGMTSVRTHSFSKWLCANSSVNITYSHSFRGWILELCWMLALLAPWYSFPCSWNIQDVIIMVSLMDLCSCIEVWVLMDLSFRLRRLLIEVLGCCHRITIK